VHPDFSGTRIIEVLPPGGHPRALRFAEQHPTPGTQARSDALGTSVARNIMLLLCQRILDSQTISPTPGFLQDVGGQIPVPEQFSFEPQFQLDVQRNSGNEHPFAYAHGLEFRPWIHYDGVPNLTVTGAVSYVHHFTVPGTNYYRHPEWRFTGFGTLKQTLEGLSM
jgi:hypothetical protein